MPRSSRIKTPESIYHIMSRSISEIDLFKDDADKVKYIYFIKKYQQLHKFKIYAYCFMLNHVHMIVDANGSDISQFMHRINFSYAIYYNNKYKRHGHLFQDRFKSKIINNMNYLLQASVYIHKNPVKITGYENTPEQYKFSSLAIYLDLSMNSTDLVDPYFILRLLGDDLKICRQTYKALVDACVIEDDKEIEFLDEKSLYKSQRTILARSLNFNTILSYVASFTNNSKSVIFTKNNRNATDARALLVMLLKCLCNFNSTQVCASIGNITQSNVSRLTQLGFNLLNNSPPFQQAYEDFINMNA